MYERGRRTVLGVVRYREAQTCLHTGFLLIVGVDQIARTD